ncbi:MAG: hypothetical protein WAV55_05395, partial [Clostridiaceae bacterium]
PRTSFSWPWQTRSWSSRKLTKEQNKSVASLTLKATRIRHQLSQGTSRRTRCGPSNRQGSEK